MLGGLVGAVIGNLLIGTLFAPSLRRLRDAFEKFGLVDFPFEYDRGDEWGRRERFRQAQDAASLKFNYCLRDYAIAFGRCKRIGLVFCASLILLEMVAIWGVPFSF